jgi:radical SAM superfamily enzyme YgiQ (UPF0313 family)
VNAGDYPADAAFDKYFKHYLKHNNREISLVGSYAKIKTYDLKKRYDRDIYILNGFEYRNPNYDVIEFKKYPKVNGKYKLNIRHTYGCPRCCYMCPVPLCFGRQYHYHKNTANIIANFYGKGVRYFTFIDDNLDMAKNFVSLLKELKAMNLKGVQYHCQEGFDVACFTEEIARLLKQLRFDNIKIAFENINASFLKKINKSHVTLEKIERAIEIAKKYNIKIGTFFLLGLDETEGDILDNLKFFAKHKLSIRANIIRDYGNFFSKRNIERRYDDDVYKKYKALAYTVNFFNSLDINIFEGKKALDKAGYSMDTHGPGIVVYGKTKFGFRTNYFEKGIEYIFKGYMVSHNSGNYVQLIQKRKGFLK